MDKFAIILAGGVGQRAGGDLPKQFRPLCGRPLGWWAMKAFVEADPEIRIVLVVHPGFMDDWEIMWEELPKQEQIPFLLSCGGRTRFESVKNGLMTVRDAGGENSIVFIHDGARPMVTPAMVRRGLAALLPLGGAIPAVRPVCSLRELENPESPLPDAKSYSVDRARFVEVQTPQIFHYSTIAPLYYEEKDSTRFTDDASLVENHGVKISLYEGDTLNIKVTNPEDFAIAEAIIRYSEK